MSRTHSPADPTATRVALAESDPSAVCAALVSVADALCDVAGSFTCDEAEALAVLLTWAGRPGKAETFLACHGADGDTDVDDRHRSPAAVLAALERLGVPISQRGEDRVARVTRLFSGRA